jgi:hypothetical protein
LAMGNALILFGLLLNHQAHAFSWIRSAGWSADGSRVFVETMIDYPACVRWITDTDGRVLDVATITIAADPRLEIQEQIHATIRVYNYLIRAAETQLPQIVWKDPPKPEKAGDTKELVMNVRPVDCGEARAAGYRHGGRWRGRYGVVGSPGVPRFVRVSHGSIIPPRSRAWPTGEKQQHDIQAKSPWCAHPS